MSKHRGTMAALVAAVTAISCQTEQPLQRTPAERGEQKPGRTMLADSELAHRVQIGLANDPVLAETAIRVETVDGVVRLRGVVYSRTQQTRALEIARAIDGVRRIDDVLVRHGRSGVTDGPLAQIQMQL